MVKEGFWGAIETIEHMEAIETIEIDDLQGLVSMSRSVSHHPTKNWGDVTSPDMAVLVMWFTNPPKSWDINIPTPGNGCHGFNSISNGWIEYGWYGLILGGFRFVMPGYPQVIIQISGSFPFTKTIQLLPIGSVCMVYILTFGVYWWSMLPYIYMILWVWGTPIFRAGTLHLVEPIQQKLSQHWIRMTHFLSTRCP